MKRILCIGIILGTLLMASNAFCGTDDSTLQVATLNFGEMMGETADVGQEDTKIAQYSLNMFQSGNGMCSYPFSPVSGIELTGEVVSATDSFLLVDPVSTKCSAYYTNFAGLSKGVLVTTDAYIKTLAEPMSFDGLNKKYLFTGNHLISSTDYFITTSEVTIPTTSSGSHGALWQNRFWIANRYTLYYSAAQNYEDFTNSATAGGTTNIFGVSSISKLVGTRYGLYIFTDKGIFLQSGSSKAWTIEKISDLIFALYSITTFNDDIYFRVNALGGRKVWKISGTSVEVFCDIPVAIDSTLMPFILDDMVFSNSGRLLILANKTWTGFSWVYDIKNKSWSRSQEYNFVTKSYYIKITDPSINRFTYYYLPNAEQFDKITNFWLGAYLTPLEWKYKTAWMTLDGNASNRKEIDRIEFDYLGGTSSVLLYFSNGNGSESSWGSYLYAPTNSRLSTYVWNNPMGNRKQSNRFYLYFQSVGAQTMTTNYILKQARIYYRNIGNYKTNTLR